MIKHIKNMDLRQIAESGQCFRMAMTGDNSARVIAGGRVLYINEEGEGRFDLSCDDTEYEVCWRDYFDADTDYSVFIDAIDKKDSFLTKAAAYGSGIRILRQEPFETLISFIISQRKNIPAIQSSVEKLCRTCGTKSDGSCGSGSF